MVYSLQSEGMQKPVTVEILSQTFRRGEADRMFQFMAEPVCPQTFYMARIGSRDENVAMKTGYEDTCERD